MCRTSCLYARRKGACSMSTSTATVVMNVLPRPPHTPQGGVPIPYSPIALCGAGGSRGAAAAARGAQGGGSGRGGEGGGVRRRGAQGPQARAEGAEAVV